MLCTCLFSSSACATACRVRDITSDAAWRAVETNYYNFDGWRTSVLREGSCPTAAELKPHCIAALNAVVSQEVHQLVDVRRC